MDKEKYELLKSVILKRFRFKGKTTFTKLSAATNEEFKRNGTEFKGSIPWHLE
jgi:hypothetical protein